MVGIRTTRLGAYWGLALLLCLGANPPAYAQGKEAAHSLVPKYLNRMLEPPQSDHDAFLIVTAGGASTEVLVIANPSVPAPRLVQALQAAVAATPLRSQPIEWSAPTERIPWVAAHVSLHRGHLGAWQAQNTVPFNTFGDNLKRAGFEPLPSLHLPVGVSCAGLPSPYADFNGDRWYFLGGSKRPRISLQVTDGILPAGLFPLLLPFLLIPGLGLLSQGAAVGWAQRKDPVRLNRKRFDLIAAGPPGAALIAWMIVTAGSVGSLSQLDAMNDVWLGQTGSGNLFSAWFVLILMVSVLTFWNGQRLTIRRYGPEGSVPVEAMSGGERSLSERESLWAAALPLLMCGAVLVLVLGGQSWLSGMPPWAAQLAVRSIPVLLLIPVVVYFSRKRKAFTTLVPDAALTDTLRPLVAAPGLPPVQVSVEQSARAKSYSFIEGRPGGLVVVSQKLTEMATPDQIRFLLTAQSVLGRTRDWSTPITLLTIFGVLGGVGVAILMMSHGLFTFAIVLMVLLLPALFVGIGLSDRHSMRRVCDADWEALRLTGNLDAARGALTLLRENAMPAASGRSTQATLQLTKRIAALEKESATSN